MKMASETVLAAKILCDASRRQKLRELGQNFCQDMNRGAGINQNRECHHSGSPITTRLPLFGSQVSSVARPVNLNEAHSRLSGSPTSLVHQNPGRNSATTGERPGTRELGSLLINFAESTNTKEWSYSAVTGKLYAARNKRINLQVSDQNYHFQLVTDKENFSKAESCFLRFLLVYGSDQHATRPVVRCQQHQDGNRLSGSPNEVIDLSPATRFSSVEEEHVIRCHNVGAQHVRDQVSGRYSVVVPTRVVLRTPIKSEYPQATGSSPGDSVDVDLSFGCLNTCLGAEYSLRNWNIVITLERSDRSILGRKTIPVKVCAAPKRERCVEEENTLKGKQKRSRNSNADEEDQRKSFPVESPKVNSFQDDSNSPFSSKADTIGKFSILVDSLDEYNLLTSLRDELRSSPTLRAYMQSKVTNKTDPMTS